MKKAFPHAVVFDLDGVITDTALLHYQAWNIICENLGLQFDETVNEQLKGISREESFEIILRHNQATEKYTNKEKKDLCKEKNIIYVDLLKQLSQQDILPGVVAFLEQLRAANIPTAVASASKNAPAILEKLNLSSYFQYISNPALIANPKPAPDIFLDCCKALGVDAKHCIGVEDSDAGVQAIKAAHMFALGVGVVAQSKTSLAPDVNLVSTNELHVDLFAHLANNV
ncbi:MAG: beta-phosphoglucomutase [Erysipelotrichaceae bacterium]